MGMDKPTQTEVRKAIGVVIAHLESDWGFCKDKDYTMGCASCEATHLKRQLQSVADFLDE